LGCIEWWPTCTGADRLWFMCVLCLVQSRVHCIWRNGRVDCIQSRAKKKSTLHKYSMSHKRVWQFARPIGLKSARSASIQLISFRPLLRVPCFSTQGFATYASLPSIHHSIIPSVALTMQPQTGDYTLLPPSRTLPSSPSNLPTHYDLPLPPVVFASRPVSLLSCLAVYSEQ